MSSADDRRRRGRGGTTNARLSTRRRKARSLWLRGSFEMTARLDADELTHALDRDPELANAQGWASERGRYPGLVEDSVSACDAILPWAFTQHAAKGFRRRRKEARIRYRRLPSGDWQGLAIVKSV